MAGEKFRSEISAYQAFARLLEQAEGCADAFRNASIDVPEPLKRLLAEEVEGNDDPREKQLSLIAPIRREHTPPEAEKDWISVPLKECTATSVTLAILRGAKGPMRSRDVKNAVIALLPNATAGVVANIATRLRETVIGIEDDGWVILKPERAPILDGDFLWGPAGPSSVFLKQELAAHRREAILLILEKYPSGLQIVQIVDELNRLGWVQAPCNKDLVKDDMQVLYVVGKVRKRGSSGKWEIGREERKM